jgi:hypothetical protein
MLVRSRKKIKKLAARETYCIAKKGLGMVRRQVGKGKVQKEKNPARRETRGKVRWEGKRPQKKAKWESGVKKPHTGQTKIKKGKAGTSPGQASCGSVVKLIWLLMIT